MITLLLRLLRLLPFLVGGHRQLALENLALRHQLAIYKRTVPRFDDVGTGERRESPVSVSVGIASCGPCPRSARRSCAGTSGRPA
jgi:hypothetical protein